MKRYLFLCVLCGILCPSMRGQTTIQNLDDDPITYPNNNNTNYRSWASIINSAVGCHGTCTSTAAMSHTNYLQIDGSSLEMDLGDNGCPSQGGCYGDALFFNRVYHDSTANNATKLTLDLYTTMNSVGDSASEALEYTIEQDVQTSAGSGKWTPFVYSWQCKYSTSSPGAIWRLWNGALRSGAGDWYQVPGKTWNCVPFQPAGTFAHFVFDFQRPDSTHMYYTDFKVNTTVIPVAYTVSAPLPVANYSDGLTTEMQLDGNTYQAPYSAWADKWSVVYQ